MEAEMRYIYEVYRYRSFSKAAQALFITQPALSIAVQKVENRIGMPLFDRSSKPISLTAAGELYIQKYREIEHLEQDLMQQINDLSSLQTGTLRVGGTTYLNSFVLPPALSLFSKEFPGVRLELTEAGSGHLLQMLSDHTIDVTLNSTEAPQDTFYRYPCYVDVILISVPKSFPVNASLAEFALTADDLLQKKHREFDRPAAPLTAFSDTPFILLTPENNLRRRAMDIFAEAGITPPISMEINQLVTSFHLSSAGLGAAFVSDRLVTSASQNVYFYRVHSPHATRVFDLVFSDRHYVSKAMYAFLEIVQDTYNLHLPMRKVKAPVTNK